MKPSAQCSLIHRKFAFSKWRRSSSSFLCHVHPFHFGSERKRDGVSPQSEQVWSLHTIDGSGRTETVNLSIRSSTSLIWTLSYLPLPKIIYLQASSRSGR